MLKDGNAVMKFTLAQATLRLRSIMFMADIVKNLTCSTGGHITSSSVHEVI